MSSSASVWAQESALQMRVRARVGLWVFLTGELLFFGGLLSAWFVQRAGLPPQAPLVVTLGLGRASVATLVLLSSSLCLWRAGRAWARGARSAARSLVGCAWLLGAAFLANQLHELASLLGAGHTSASSIPWAWFHLLTGVHGLHVLGGLLALGLALWRMQGADSRAPLTLELTALYWHFVDGVWWVLFTLLYLF